MCLERSKVCEVVDAQTIRSVLSTAGGEMWREGEFRLEYVWKILCQQPGLTAKEVAPPLLVFKAYEAELGVHVRVPQALSSLPRGEQVRLRDELGVTKADFAKVIADLQALADVEAAKASSAKAASQAAETAAPQAPAPIDRGGSYGKPKKVVDLKQRRRIALALIAVALAALPTGLYFTFRDTAKTTDTADLTALVHLVDARREGVTLVGRIDDPVWENLPRPDQQKRAEQVFEIEVAKGVQSMTLTDAIGRSRVIATDVEGKRMIIVR